MFDLETLCTVAASGLLAGIAGYLIARRATGRQAIASCTLVVPGSPRTFSLVC